jgi:hypothetical protein
MGEPVAALYRARSWSSAPDGQPTERQPHLFYRAEDVDRIFDELRAELSFERRRHDALQEFYLKEAKWRDR